MPDFRCDVRGCTRVYQFAMPLTPVWADCPDSSLRLCAPHHEEVVRDARLLAPYETLREFRLLHAGA